MWYLKNCTLNPFLFCSVLANEGMEERSAVVVMEKRSREGSSGDCEVQTTRTEVLTTTDGCGHIYQ